MFFNSFPEKNYRNFYLEMELRDKMSRRNAKHFERQGEITLSPQPPNQNCMDAVLIGK
jgi:hypothetical protein